MIRLDWATFKTFLSTSKAQHFYIDDGVNYHVRATDGMFKVGCSIGKTGEEANKTDFETNYKDTASGSFLPQSIRTLLARGAADTVNGVATIYIPIPTGGRTISGGKAWFASPTEGDYVLADIYDRDNVMSHPSGPQVLMAWEDQDVPATNAGWHASVNHGLTLQPLIANDPKTYDGGLAVFLRVRGYKNDLAVSDKLLCNVHWGIRVRG